MLPYWTTASASARGKSSGRLFRAQLVHGPRSVAVGVGVGVRSLGQGPLATRRILRAFTLPFVGVAASTREGRILASR